MLRLTHGATDYSFAVNGTAGSVIKIDETEQRPLRRDVLDALLEVGVGYIALGRLGCPRSGNVHVEVDGPLPEAAMRPIERLLANVMTVRSAVAGMPTASQVRFRSKRRLRQKIPTSLDRNKVIVPSSGGMDSSAILRFCQSSGLVPIPLFVEYDEGPVSFVKEEWIHHAQVLSALGLADSERQRAILFSRETQGRVPWNTDQYGTPYAADGPIQDTDRWEIWGRDLALSAAVLRRALSEGAAYINLGHTKENLFSLHQASDGTVFYDRCCRSLHSMVEWNRVLASVFEPAPAVVASLRDCSKGAIGAYLLEKPHVFAHTRSCIGTERLECGYCFSCTDKLASILANAKDADLRIDDRGSEGVQVVYDGVEVANFGWFPTRSAGGVWGRQLRRLAAAGGSSASINLQHSIYNPEGILSAMHTLDVKHLGDYIPVEYEAVKAVLPASTLEATRDRYVRNPGFLLPRQFLFDSISRVKGDYVLTGLA